MGYATHYWVMLVYTCFVVALVAGMIGVSHFLGQRHMKRATSEPFESGIVTVGYARFRLPVQFYLIAMFFVIFDLEAAYLYAWATAVQAAGWTGYIVITIFILALLAALVYLWRAGALEWGPRPRPLARARGR
ncbi:MAG: NADH:ubiquinone oxidoreductase subunit A [Acidiphilium sp. 21-60-14]|nr:MAG: NADH:ubiquinone oxidoreductase subunit A [Acidiphilium sp. 21-60-14]OYW04948.1 MAG: NADH:ubiquinone oxidoreductase subunit A [Acidiphilium sp. 37-67-22]HQT75257.1 NADH-quinone oxidoreductase subunit A [Acidiphilium sp.]